MGLTPSFPSAVHLAGGELSEAEASEGMRRNPENYRFGVSGIGVSEADSASLRRAGRIRVCARERYRWLSVLSSSAQAAVVVVAIAVSAWARARAEGQVQ
jgi:hypothetical protein